MKHGVHLMFGSDFSESLLTFKKYINKFGSTETASFVHALLWNESKDNKDIIISEALQDPNINNLKFNSGIEDDFNTILKEISIIPSANKKQYTLSFFQKLFDSRINLDTKETSSKLSLFIYLPLYDIKLWNEVKFICEVIKELPVSYDIDIIGLAPDLAGLFTNAQSIEELPQKAVEYDNNAAKHIGEIVQYRKDKLETIKNVFLLQNYSSLGLSLNLNLESFTKIIGEMACMLAQYYNDTIVSSAELKTIGISMVNFDKYYFIQYLLSRTYLLLMDNANIQENEINVNEVVQISERLLANKSDLINQYWNNSVKKKLATGVSIESIVPETDKEIKNLLKDVTKELNSFLNVPEETYSIPRKKAILASLLGFDDELIEGNQFIDNQTIVDDLQAEGCILFIDANNKLLEAEQFDKAVLSPTGEPVEFCLPEIKQLRNSIKTSTTYIRRTEKELKKISQQMDDSKTADKRLISDGSFIYEGKRFKLLPETFIEHSLDETYEPKKVANSNIDLRPRFTRILNQGNQGSCSAFALIGIYEYILKSGGNFNEALSKSFLYYNSRKRSDSQEVDTGSTIYDAISSLSETGTCKESLFPYNESTFNLEPSSDAYEDAKGNLVRKALNVNGNIEDIKSAIAEGYPVVFGLKIFNSFGDNNKGFIYHPTEQDIQESENGSYHAMVICGFSENEKVFVVRNSWGEAFGDKGYCYIPYSYVTDKRFFNAAFIITEINHDQKINNDSFGKVNFDTTDANIQYAITKVQLEEEKVYLGRMQRRDQKLRKLHLEMIAKLRHPRYRKILIEGSKESLVKESSSIYKKQEGEIEKVDKKISFLNKSILKWSTLLLGSFFLFLSLFILYHTSDSSYKSDNYQLANIAIFMSVVSLVAFIIYITNRILRKKLLVKEKKEIRTFFTSQLYYNNKKRDEIEVYNHIAGEILERLFDLEDELKSKYHVLESYLGNLKVWQQEEIKKSQAMSSTTRAPFASLNDNEIMDRYFSLKKKDIIKDLSLSAFIGDYKLSESDIVAFKNNLKRRVIETLTNQIHDFTILDYALGKKDYPYLSSNSEDLINLLPHIDRMANVFLLLNNETKASTAHKVIAVSTDRDSNKSEWGEKFPKAFSQKPVSLYINNPYKLVIMNILDLYLTDVRIAKTTLKK